MDPVTVGLIIAGIGGSLLGTRSSNAAAAREAEKNRQFQKEMSNTAHQREMADLRAAGLHPALTAMGGSGASSPSGAVAPVLDKGESISRGVASALALKQMKSNIDLTNAQAAAANAAGQLSNAQAGDIVNTQKGRMGLTQAQTLVAQADFRQRQELLPMLVERAKGEAKSASAMAVLDNLSISGAKNVATFEKQIGSLGPWSRLLLEVLRSTPLKRR